MACIVFPEASAGLASRALRHVPCYALLHAPDGTLWFLRTTGHAWTPERADAARAFLCGQREGALERDRMEARLAYELGLPAVSIPDPALDASDDAVWDVRRTAAVLAAGEVARGACVRAVEVAARVEAIERDLRTALAQKLAELDARLDPEARTLARRGGRIDLELYNFLARGPRREWRLQFARTFPLLVRAAAAWTSEPLGAQIRASIDSGRPLVKALAARWGVGPGTVRCLIGRTVEQVGVRWEAYPLALVRVLDALRPEDRPGEDPRTWARLAEAVDTAEEIFRKPVTASPLPLAWMREAACGRFTRAAAAGEGGGDPADEARAGSAGALARAAGAFTPDAIAATDRLREALILELARGLQGAIADTSAELRVTAATVADHGLSALSPRRLAAAAERFAREAAQRRAALDVEPPPLPRRGMWPLLPAEASFVEGLRRVVPLVTREAIAAEGARQDLCIKDGGYLNGAVGAMRRGSAFYVSLRDALSGRTMSTAEIRARRPFRGGLIELSVVQHRAQGNSEPSSTCRQALRELLAAAGGKAMQAHLEAGGHFQRRQPEKTPAQIREAERQAAAEALEATLGGTFLEAARQRVRAAAAAGAAGAVNSSPAVARGDRGRAGRP